MFRFPLTWSLCEHLTMLPGWSQARAVKSTDLDEVMSVWQHVLQPSLVDCGGDKYAVCSRLWIVVLSPVLNLWDPGGEISKGTSCWNVVKMVLNAVPGTLRCTAGGSSQCPPLAATRPELLWRTLVWRTHLLEARLVLKSRSWVKVSLA